jgi:hypothetical protein
MNHGNPNDGGPVPDEAEQVPAPVDPHPDSDDDFDEDDVGRESVEAIPEEDDDDEAAGDVENDGSPPD